MAIEAALNVSQHIAQAGLFLVAAIAIFGGSPGFHHQGRFAQADGGLLAI